MKVAARVVSALALAGTILPPLLFLARGIDLDATQASMLVATIAWFIATPVWMEHGTGD